MPNDKKTITLYLSSWQKRMMKDYLEPAALKKISLEKLTRITIKVIDKNQWVMYRQPIDFIKNSWNLYLTDEQINAVSVKLGIRARFSALNISPELMQKGDIMFE
jgi:hypothetical protein